MATDYVVTPKSSSYTTSRREHFTLWMKSLVFHSHGCTVYNSNGQLVYRVDNYDQKHSTEVNLMDPHGKVLFSVRQKRAPVFRHWDGYKACNSKTNRQIPCFQVRKDRRILRGEMCYHVTLWCNNEAHEEASCLKMVELPGRTGFKIVDGKERLLAEMKKKKSSSGVNLGDDVLSLTVEPHVDHSLVMALVTVYSMIHHKI